MSQLVNIFLDNLMPILLIAAIGYGLGKWLNINPRSISQVVFYVFSPALVFRLLTHSELSNAEIIRTMGIAFLTISAVGLLTWFLGRAFKLERSVLAAVLITAMFMNAGNYGLPVTESAFGQTALAHASLFFAVSAMYTNTVGVLVVSSGHTNLLSALKNLFKLPATYALLLGILFVQLDWQLPNFLDKSVRLLGQAAIPSMLVMLGMQFINARWDGHLVPILISGSMRMLVAPLIALGLTRFFGVTGAAFQAITLEAAMPAAVLTTVLAMEFDTQPTLVSAIVLTTTLLSPFTLTPLLALLGA